MLIYATRLDGSHFFLHLHLQPYFVYASSKGSGEYVNSIFDNVMNQNLIAGLYIANHSHTTAERERDSFFLMY